MNGREYVAYLADNGFDILLTDDQIEGGVDDSTIENLLTTMERDGLINTRQHPLWTVLDCIIKVMNVSEKEKLLLRQALRNPPAGEIADSLGCFHRLVNILPQYGQGSKIAQEFIRCKNLFRERAAYRQYPAVVERLKLLPTPSWLEPGRMEFDVTQREIYRNACFGVDFSLCNEYLKARGLIPVCDGSVRSILLREPDKCSNPEYLEIFDDVVFTGILLNRLVKDFSNVVWIGCGTSFGLSIRDNDECKFADVIRDGGLYGVVGASALNQGYGALTLYQWKGNKEEKGLLRNPQVEFRRGVYKSLSANN